MPRRDWPLRVQDMLDEIGRLLRHTASVDQAQFNIDEVLQGDVLYRVGILGEAVAHITEEVKQRHPSIPWRDIRNMRNRLTHAYYRVNLEQAWAVITDELAPLREQLLALQQAEGLTDPAAGGSPS